MPHLQDVPQVALIRRRRRVRLVPRLVARPPRELRQGLPAVSVGTPPHVHRRHELRPPDQPNTELLCHARSFPSLNSNVTTEAINSAINPIPPKTPISPQIPFNAFVTRRSGTVKCFGSSSRTSNASPNRHATTSAAQRLRCNARTRSL